MLVAHTLGPWKRFPHYDVERAGNWYNLGFLVGAGIPILGGLGGSRTAGSRS